MLEVLYNVEATYTDRHEASRGLSSCFGKRNLEDTALYDYSHILPDGYDMNGDYLIIPF